MTAKVKVKTITFLYKEGLIWQCDALPLATTTFKQAHSLMMTWADTAPDDGCYDKLDFVVEWENGEEYKGRYDLKHWRVEMPNLAKHM